MKVFDEMGKMEGVCDYFGGYGEEIVLER